MCKCTFLQKQLQTNIASVTNVYLFLRINTIKTIFVCFVALRPKSTAMAIAGRSVHLTTLFPGQA